MIYNKFKFKEIKETNPSMAFKEVGAMVAEGYRNLTAQERENYQKMCDEENKVRFADFQKQQENSPQPQA